MSDSTAMVLPAPQGRKRVSARFEYKRMTGADLAAWLHELDLPADAFCRIFGVRPEVMARWLKDEQDIPPWVFVVVWLLKETPNGNAIARTAAANHIRIDRKFPDRGEFPYLRIPDEGDDDRD